MQNIGDIITIIEKRLRQKIGEAGSRFSTQEIIDWSNYGQYLVCKELALLRFKHPITSTGVQSYTLAGNTLYPVIGIVCATYNNEGPPLDERDLPYVLSIYGTEWNESGTPKDYWFTDEIFTEINFVPYAQAGSTYELYCVKRPATISGISTNFEVPEEYVMAILEWVWWCVQVGNKDKTALDLLAMGKPAPAFYSMIEIEQRMKRKSKITPVHITSRQSRYDPLNI